MNVLRRNLDVVMFVSVALVAVVLLVSGLLSSSPAASSSGAQDGAQSEAQTYYLTTLRAAYGIDEARGETIGRAICGGDAAGAYRTVLDVADPSASGTATARRALLREVRRLAVDAYCPGLLDGR